LIDILKGYTFVVLKVEIMKTISLKIDDSIFGETEKILSKIKKPRNRYINDAIEYYNQIQKRTILEKKLKKESDLVKADSMDVLKDFEEIDYAG
jgi:hypothetical protein